MVPKAMVAKMPLGLLRYRCSRILGREEDHSPSADAEEPGSDEPVDVRPFSEGVLSIFPDKWSGWFGLVSMG